MKKTTIALLAVCAALFAYPGIASAGTWHMTPTDGSTTQTFTVTGGTMERLTLNASGHSVQSKIHCTSTSGSGAYENTTTGTLTLKIHGCTSSGFNCTGAGEPVGTTTSTQLTFHNVLLHNGVPGILITPNHVTGVFAHYVCGGFITVTIVGNGLIGTSTASCGSTTNTTEWKFEKNATNTQLHSQVTTTGTVYDLKRSTGEKMTKVFTEKIALQKQSFVNCT